MISIPEELLITLFIALVIIGLSVLILDVRLLSHLRKHHSHLWISLGSPSLMLNNTISNNRKVYLFIKNYNSIEDPALKKRAKVLYFLTLTYMCYFMIFFIIGLIYIDKSRHS